MGFAVEKGPGTEAILRVLQDYFVANVVDTAGAADEFGPRKQLLIASRNLGITKKIGQAGTVAGQDWAGAWENWLTWLYDDGDPESKRFRVHEKVRTRIYTQLTSERGKAIWCDWGEQTKRLKDPEYQERPVGSDLYYMKVITKRFPIAAVKRLKRRR